MSAAVGVAVAVAAVLILVGAVLAIVRAERGPSMLDRTVALDIVVTCLVAAVALYAAAERRADVVRASIEVAVIALTPRCTPRGAVVGVQLRSHSDLYLTLTAELVSLVPGSLVVEAQRLTGMLYLHVLDLERSGGAEAVRAHVLAQEERLLRALASPDEQAAAGVVTA